MKIEFVPGTKDIEELVPCPDLGKNFIPQWYKDIPGGKENINVKRCMPFLDSISVGYIQKTWTDIYVENNNEKVSFLHNHKVTMFLSREQTHIPVSEYYYQTEFIWQRPWSIILPDGMSALITHPINRIDLPFTTMSGVVDFDKSIHAPIGNIPFFIKKDFVGLIPKGTPMFQILPFERNKWQSEKQSFSQKFWQEKINEKGNVLGFYKKKIWQKKHFD
jgi:hypothetical protein